MTQIKVSLLHFNLLDVSRFVDNMLLAVGGCEYKEPEDPGNLELDWLEVQLNQYRDRNMQVQSITITNSTDQS